MFTIWFLASLRNGPVVCVDWLAAIGSIAAHLLYSYSIFTSERKRKKKKNTHGWLGIVHRRWRDVSIPIKQVLSVPCPFIITPNPHSAEIRTYNYT